jgi:tetratricopeptide (TPR) repeat protein
MSSRSEKKAGTSESSHHLHHADEIKTIDLSGHADIPVTVDMNSTIDWQRLLSDPSLVPCFLDEPSVTETVGRIDSTTAGLTYIPWKLAVVGDHHVHDSASIPVVAPSTKDNDNGTDSNDQKPAATSNTNSSISGSSNTLAQQQYFPSQDYLSLRRLQNRAWADQRLLQGIQYAKQLKYAQAENAYRQGLDLVKNHVDLLVASAALHANQGKRDRALLLLEQALQENPNHANALEYKQEIEAYQQQQAQKLAQRPAKADRAMQDASLERSFESGNGVAKASADVTNETAYPLLGSEEEDDDDGHHRKKKRKRKKRHKKTSKRRHRRRSYDSDSSRDDDDGDDDDDGSISSEAEEDSSRKRSRRRRKKQRRKERRRSDDRKEEPSVTKETTQVQEPIDHGSRRDKNNDADSSKEVSRRRDKRQRKDRKHKRQRRSIQEDDDSYSGSPSDSGETVDSLQISRERKGDNDRESSKGESRRRHKRRHKDRKRKRQRRSIRDDDSSSEFPSDSGDTVDSLQISRERKGGRPSTRPPRDQDDDKTKGC